MGERTDGQVCRPPESCQYLILAGRLLFCTRQRRAAGAVQGIECKHIDRAQPRNRALNEGPGALGRSPRLGNSRGELPLRLLSGKLGGKLLLAQSYLTGTNLCTRSPANTSPV
jgi:hypothetical protein